jgi:hypothetical protein
MEKSEYSTEFTNLGVALEKLGKSVDTLGPGLAKLREVNDEIEARAVLARSLVTDEKVFALMETSMLDYDYARELLELAYENAALYGEENDDEEFSGEHASPVSEGA